METNINPVVIPNSQRRIIVSRGREYHIFISVPLKTAPQAGFPVIYLLDANSVFGTMTETIRAQSRFPERTGVEPSIVVGIGYDTDAPFHTSRHYDFTYPVPHHELPPHPDDQSWPEQGGSSAFLHFIEDELKPAMERDFPIDTSRQTLLGHSLGGLFVLSALFAKPYSFQTYIAGSPSIYWNEKRLLEQERVLPSLLKDGKPIRLLLTIGELERGAEGQNDEKIEAMAARLSKLPNHRLSVTYKKFEDESHISVLPLLMSQGIRFATRSHS
ncbi:alpha/beta hydrolase [Paenibacillus mendelii]|uniref:Alpha/beta hydrolase n=1 Tax=Paenibacillus mendelii TaxID=206163 RepID=A0ABV6J863_9BACL|nr:alpha/beta hydrolase-fold protein [Paenibacillus mendelii]MCQ6561273.1 alpha/beta hydrolase-fold protein [Paenibacillus mendelii]